MKVGRNCPLCRAKRPSSAEEEIKQLRPWVKKKKAWAQNVMGQMYRDGEGVKQSYVMAKRLFKQAAQQGDASAMAHLGDMYYNGWGVEVSSERAKEYCEQAADLNHAGAQFNLGAMYYKGQGVTTNYVKAREWWNKSAAQGQEEAIKYLNLLPKEERRATTTKTSSKPDAIVCSNCNTPQTESHKLIRCPCHSVQYCNKACQTKHRKKHKKKCRKLLAEKKKMKTMNTTKNKTER
jgi:TPR repeat protein